MKPELLKQIEKAKNYMIIVEGKKDFFALKELGFVLLKERISHIEGLANFLKNKK